MHEQTRVSTGKVSQGNSKELLTEGTSAPQIGAGGSSQEKMAAKITVLPITIGNKHRAIVVGHVTVLDDDFTRDVLKKMRWHFDDNGYARHSPSYATPVRLHILIYAHYHGKIRKGFVVDHEDRNLSNNLPTNLRSVSRSVNGANKRLQSNNKTGCPRVHVEKKTGKFIAQASIPGTSRSVHLGSFDDKQEAIAAAREAFSKNFPSVNPTQYPI